MQNVHLPGCSAEAFRYYVHHYQCLAVPIEKQHWIIWLAQINHFLVRHQHNCLLLIFHFLLKLYCMIRASTSLRTSHQVVLFITVYRHTLIPSLCRYSAIPTNHLNLGREAFLPFRFILNNPFAFSFYLIFLTIIRPYIVSFILVGLHQRMDVRSTDAE